MLWAKYLLIATACLAMALSQDDQFYDETPVDPMIPYADDPSESTATEGLSSDSSSDPTDPSGIIGIVTFWPNELSRQERPPRPPRPDRCPKWSEWKNVTCWWPSISFTDLPQECTYMSLPKKIPKDVQDLIRGKAQEAYDAIIYEYEQRGKPPKCGYCSRSFKCRSRNMTQDDAENSMNDFERRHHHRHGGRGRHGRDQCKPKEIQPVHDECDDHSPCEVTKENGICKTPFFLNPAKIDRVRSLIKQKDHQGAADELFASMTDEGRKKRQAGFGDDYINGDVYGYGMNPQYDSPNGFGDGGRRFRFHGRQQQQFGPGPQDESRPFGPRDGPSFGPRGGDDRPMPPRPFGPWNNDRQGRQGPPPSFGPGDEGQRGPFGPREDERRSPFEPDGRRGREGPFPPPPPPFGSDGDDDRHGRRQGPMPPPFGPDGERGPFGPGHGRREGPPPPPPPFGPRDDDRWGPSGGRRQGPMPPFGPGGDEDHEWGPFGPPGGGPFGPPSWGPFGPGGRRGRHGPMPPPFGPGGDEDRRRGRQWPPRPWRPPGRGHHHHRGPWGGFGGENQENEDFNQRQIISTSSSNRRGGGEDSRGFVYRLLHETNCVNANDTCLCCCGPYIPNVTNKTCDDLRQLFPGIEDTADALLMGNEIGNDGDDQDSQPPPPPESPMEELSPSDELPFAEMPVPQQQQRRNNPDGPPSGPVKIPKPQHDFK